MYAREGITGSNPVLSANRKMEINLKKIILILWIQVFVLLGIFFLSSRGYDSLNTEEVPEEEIILRPAEMSQSDSISVRQYRRMDSLHAAGKL
jgi:hypothetical protein